MSENVETVRRLVQANRSGAPDETVERAVALADCNFEFTSRLTSVEGSRTESYSSPEAALEAAGLSE